MKVTEGDFAFRSGPASELDPHEEFFDTIMKEVTEEHTMIGPQRLSYIYHLAKEASDLEADMAEVGSWRGGCGRLIARVARESARVVHLFDTFSGLPAPAEGFDPDLREGQFEDTSFEFVHNYLKDLGNIRIHEGLFPATAQGLTEKSFSFVHVDCDLYHSIVACCEFFWPRLLDGGTMLFDDYTYYLGAQKAVVEFFADKPETPFIIQSGQVIVRRDRSAQLPVREYAKCPHCGAEISVQLGLGG